MFGRLRKRDVTTDAAASASATTPLAEENLRLRRAVEQLALLNDLAQAMGLSDSSNEMIQAIVHRAKQTLAAEQVMIYFVERSHDGDQFKTRVRDATQHTRRSFHFDAVGQRLFHRVQVLIIVRLFSKEPPDEVVVRDELRFNEAKLRAEQHNSHVRRLLARDVRAILHETEVAFGCVHMSVVGGPSRACNVVLNVSDTNCARFRSKVTSAVLPADGIMHQDPA